MKNKENRTCEINEWNIGKLEIRSDCLSDINFVYSFIIKEYICSQL